MAQLIGMSVPVTYNITDSWWPDQIRTAVRSTALACTVVAMKLGQTVGTCRTLAAGIQTDRFGAVRGGCTGKDQCHSYRVLRYAGRTRVWHSFHCRMWLAKSITWFTFTLSVWEKLSNPIRVACMFIPPNFFRNEFVTWCLLGGFYCSIGSLPMRLYTKTPTEKDRRKKSWEDEEGVVSSNFITLKKRE